MQRGRERCTGPDQVGPYATNNIQTLNWICSEKPSKGFNWGIAYIFTISLWLVCGEWIGERQK